MPYIQTVRGAVQAEELGVTLTHEHIMVDFEGQGSGAVRWDRDAVVSAMLPHLSDAQSRGVSGFVDCTPMYLGRDVLILRRLSEETGIHILTNTGLYKEPYLPATAFSRSAAELADEWTVEWTDGIEGTGIKPGFVKIAVNQGHLLPIQAKIVRAAALTHLATSLPIVCHTNDAIAAHEALDIVETEGMDPARYIVAHAHNITDAQEQAHLAQRGCWMAYDGIGGRPLEEMLRLVDDMLSSGRVGQVLLSHDAGWYRVGQPDGGSTRPFTALFDIFLPAMRQRGISADTIDRLLVANPRRAFCLP